MSSEVSGNNSLTPELVEVASRRCTPEWRAIEHLLKGPEVDIEPGYLDGGGHPRHSVRVRWWAKDADQLSSAVIMPAAVRGLDGLAYVESSDRAITLPVKPYCDRIPVFFGHYWATGEPTINSDYAACVDYSAGKDGPLVAYRYSGEDVLTSDNFASH